MIHSIQRWWSEEHLLILSSRREIQTGFIFFIHVFDVECLRIEMYRLVRKWNSLIFHIDVQFVFHHLLNLHFNWVRTLLLKTQVPLDRIKVFTGWKHTSNIWRKQIKRNKRHKLFIASEHYSWMSEITGWIFIRR